MRARLLGPILLVAAVARADVTPPPSAGGAARVRTRWPVACERVEMVTLDGSEVGFRWRGHDGREVAGSAGPLAVDDAVQVANLAGDVAGVASRAFELEIAGPGAVKLGARCAAAGGAANVSWSCTRAGCRTSFARELPGPATPVGGQATGAGSFAGLPPPPVRSARSPAEMVPALFAEARAVAAAAGVPDLFGQELGRGRRLELGGGNFAYTAEKGATRAEARCTFGWSNTCTLSQSAGTRRLATYEARVLSPTASTGSVVLQSLQVPDGSWERLVTVGGSPDLRGVSLVITGSLLPLRD